MTSFRTGAATGLQLLVMALCSFRNVAAQEISLQPASSPPLRYRRVFVPQDQLEEFTDGHMSFKRDEFLRKLELINSLAKTSNTDATWIQSADYSAVFSENQLTSGLAQLHVTHSAIGPSVLNLSPCQLALGPSMWQSAETAEEAVVGNDLAGNLVVVVRESGELRIPWTLRGVANEWGETSFQVALASAPMNRMIIDLPRDYELLADRGIVSRFDTGTATEQPLIASLADLQRWVIQLGGTNQFRLIVASQDAMRRRKQLVSLQQDTLYRLTDDGLDVDCHVELDVQREPLAVLLFRVDAQLQVTAVRLGSRDVSWSMLEGPDGRSRQLQVRFAEPLSGVHRTLQVSAVGPLRTGETWRLPQFHPQNIFWRQGNMSLVVPKTLELLHLEAQQAGQSAASSGEAGSTPAARRFQLFAPDGFLEINVARRTNWVVGEIGTTMELDQGTLAAQVVADLSCELGERYLLEADVPNAWSLDTVETLTPNSIEGHQFVEYAADHKRLQIRLARPLSPNHRSRLTIRLHRTPDFVLRADDFRPVRFHRAALAAPLVAIAPDPSFRLDVSGDAGIERLDPDGFGPALAGLVRPRSGGLVFRDGPQADSMTIKVTREDPTFASEIHVEAEIDATSITESYRLVCIPESTPITRLLVLLSEPRPSDIEWYLDHDNASLLSPRKLNEEEQEQARLGRAGEVWELVLRTPQDKRLEIVGKRKTPFSSATYVSLAALPEATSQEGWLTIRARDGTTLAIKATSSKPIPCDPQEPERRPTSRAHYRFDPSRNAQIMVDHVRPGTAPAPLWAWNCHLTSQLLATGETIHHCVFLLESAGGSEFQFHLPTACSLIGLEINGVDASGPGRDESGGSYTIPLPVDARFPHVDVAYKSPPEDYGIIGQINAPFPEVEIPVLARRWTVWLPPKYRAVASPGNVWPPSNPQTTVAQRLLGTFAAGAGERPFRLFSPQDWLSLADPRRGSGQSSAQGQLVLQLLGEQYLEAIAERSVTRVTWRGLLTDLQQGLAGRNLELAIWVDAGQLADGGFSLDQLVSDASSGLPIDVASNLLASDELVLATHGNILLLTSLDGLAHSPTSIRPTNDPAVVSVCEGSPLGVELQSLGKWTSAGMLPLQAWVADPVIAGAPWKTRRDMTRRGVSGTYWQACELEVDPEGSCVLSIQQPASLWAIGWAVLLVTAGSVSWLGTRWPSKLIPMLVVAAILAMLVPGTWIPLTANLFLGTLLACLTILVRRLAPVRSILDDTVVAETESRTNVAITMALILLTVTAVLAARELHAQDAPARDNAVDPTPVYQVIVPMDKDLNPVGDYDYLPLEFYDTIHLRALKSTSSPHHWLVRRAGYRAVFDWTQQRSSLDLTSMIAVFKLELFRPQQQIEFPWDGNNASVKIVEARLAGQPIELIWNADRTAFFLTVPSAGVSQLEFVLLPTTVEEGGGRRLQFPIPPISQSQLRIQTPFDAPDIQVVTSVGEVLMDAQSGERCAELGPAESLSLRWSTSTTRRLSARQLDVQQLVWLKIRPKDRPDSVVVDAKFRLQSSSGRIDQLTLQCDPRLRLLPIADDQLFEVVEGIPRKDGNSRLLVRFLKSFEREYTLHLQFWMLNTTGLGNLSLPRLEVVEGRVQRRWLAIGVSSELEFNTSSSDSMTSLDAAEFLTVWGEAETAPNSCFRVETDDPTWNISTRSRQTRTQSQQELDISIGSAAMNLVLNADIDTINGTAFQHSLSVPRGLRVTSVQVNASGDPITAEASHDGSGSLTVFLDRAVTGQHHLQVHGELALEPGEHALSIPDITLQDATITSRFVRLYRQPDVLVSITTPAAQERLRRTRLEPFRESFGRLVAAFDLSSNASGGLGNASIQVHPNRPTIDARLVTTLRRVDDKWEALAEFEAHVAPEPGGVADQFRFEIPAEWSEPLTLDPPMPYEIRSIPGQRRHLIVRPLQPVADRFAVGIRGALVLGANERGRTPNIIPLDTAHAERYFVLPTQLDQQRIDWETSGLQLVQLRDAIPEGPIDSRALVAYRVYSKPRAVIADVQRVAGEQQISLADVHVACQAQGECFGVVTFEIEPAGAGSCTLEIPVECEVVHVTVEGVPASLTPLADRKWQVRLSSEQLPQQLAVLFRRQGGSASPGVSLPIRVPWITDFDVVRTLWTVRRPSTTSLEGEDLESYRISAAVQETMRLRNTADLVESAVQTVMDSPASDIKAWFTPWSVRLACSDARLARDRHLADGGKQAVDPPALEAINRQQEIIAQRLNAPLSVEEIRRRVKQHPQPSDMLAFSSQPEMVADHYAFQGTAPTVSISWPSANHSNWWRQIAAAVCAAGLGGLLHYGVRRGVVLTWLRQWPYVPGVLIGLAWWLCASPSFLGWILIGASLWGAWRFPLPVQRVRETSGELAAENTS